MTVEGRLRLAALAAANAGQLTPEAVVEDARNPDSPLHHEFDWNDASAAHTARLIQARRLIVSVRLNEVDTAITVNAVCYTHDPRMPQGEQGYVSLVNVRTNADLARQVLRQEMRRIEAMIRRTESIAEVLDLEDEFHELLETVIRLQGT